MLSLVRAAPERRRAAMLEAEALVSRFGSRGVAMAQTFACDRMVDEERRHHYRRVARIAKDGHRTLVELDTATRYEELEQWTRRPGSMIRPSELSSASASAGAWRA
jgi:hypothetical protein